MALAGFLVAGCRGAGESSQSPQTDPLFGERPPERPYGVAGPTPPPQNRSAKGAAAAPQITASNSNAVCLVPEALPGAKPLAIADGSQTQPGWSSGGWQPKDVPDRRDTAAVTGGTASGNPASVPGYNPGPNDRRDAGPTVILRVPELTPIEPVPPPVVVPSVPPTAPFAVNQSPGVNPGSSPPSSSGVKPVPAINNAGTGISPVGYSESDQIQQVLKARGFVAEDQFPDPQGVRVIWRVLNPDDPNFTRVYEVIAPDYSAAVEAVLHQLDKRR